MLKIALAIALSLSLNTTYAAIRRLCNVQYATAYGWSQTYTMQVEFITGSELNNATHSYSYDSFKKYCLLWFSNGGVAINEIKDFFMCGFTFDDDAFRNLFYINFSIKCPQINSENEDGQFWKITAKDYVGQFFDPRDN